MVIYNKIKQNIFILRNSLPSAVSQNGFSCRAKSCFAYLVKGGIIMTRNQIEYSKLLETRRSNQSNEELTRSKLQEEARSHLAQEGLTRSGQLIQQQLGESTNAIRQAELQEKQRSNLAVESLREKELLESARSHMALESETRRSNVAREQENYRTNVANESIRQQQIDESKRSNLASEEIRRETNVVSSRNVALQTAATRYSADQQAKSAANALQEQKRSNQQQEYFKQQQTDLNTLQAIWSDTRESQKISLTGKDVDTRALMQQEQVRHNKASELSKIAGDLLQSGTRLLPFVMD